MHRLMWHAGDDIREFGSRRRADTDMNETLHKTTKAATDIQTNDYLN